MVLHPFTYVFAGLAMFSMAWLFPPDLYLKIVGEHNRVFFNTDVLVFNLLAIGLFSFGIAFGLRGNQKQSDIDASDATIRARTWAATIMGLAFIGLHLLSLYLMLKNVGLSGLLHAITSPQEFSKFQRNEAGLYNAIKPIGFVVPMSACTALLYTYLWRVKTSRVWHKLLFLVCCFTFCLAVATLGRRNFVVRMGLGIGIGYALHNVGRITASRTILFGAAGVLAMVAILAMGVMRRGSEQAFEAYEGVRYFIAPYNTQALIMAGDMPWDGMNGGYYWTQFLWEMPIVSDLLDLTSVYENLVGQKAPYGALERSEFLNHGGIRSGTALSAFGNSYVDFNWFGILPFLMSGWIFGWSRKQLERGAGIGLILFPLLAFATLDWRGNLHFPGPQFVVILGCALMFHVLSRLFSPRQSRSRS